MRRSRRLLLPLLAASILLAVGCGHAGPGTTLSITPELKTPPAGVTAAAYAGLSDEERSLLYAGYLGTQYPALKAANAKDGVEAARALAHTSLPGPYADDVGDPAVMLATARYQKVHPEFDRMMRALQRGDLLLISHNNQRSFIADATGGPYTHALICVDATPPALFIEAVGVTAEGGDATEDRIRVSSAAKYATDDASGRILRPARLLPEAQQFAAREKAVAFATAQLGKPYNYSFSDKAGGDDAFYCSSLVYRAYQAAGIKWPIHKDAARDRLILGVKHAVDALGPDDELAVALKFMTFMHQRPKPTPEAFGDFIVADLLPHTTRTAVLVATPKQQAGLSTAIARVLDGNAFPHFRAAAGDFKVQATKFTDPVLGHAYKAAYQARLAEDLARDAASLVGTSNINSFAALDALKVLLIAVVPYADDVAAYLTGAGSAETRSVAGLLDVLDSLHTGIKDWPADGFGLGDLPGRAPWTTDSDFISPSDVAWADVPHWDFNVRAGETMSAPWPHAIVPPDGRYAKIFAGVGF